MRNASLRKRHDDQASASPPTGGEPGAPLRAVPGGAAEAPALDRVIHERLRLGIVSALAVNESLSFNDLKALLGATDGNLSVHARKLEDAGYVECRKFFEGRQPRTVYRLTAAGRAALSHYLDHMERLIRATRDGAAPPRRPGAEGPG